jgi:hypothetical protein
MRITFTSADGKEITLADLRVGRDGSVALPPERRPAGWIMGTMIVAREEPRPASWVMGTMKV